ncbi:hypothetical protein [Treponema pedis]|uniref:Uncharacterized protein n=1 Tax=Treponema pedis str. T A4 TaxID=1291379 RepID=S5ZV48_9SPIR|nr:hypothetical protein [Treponema pedis]AGT44100.1 hypothetical protein TPE_1614 [Treponema pedis str. T A4]QSI04816.1 hypothetical protein DYQ05_07710 [Treponema pedis]
MRFDLYVCRIIEEIIKFYYKDIDIDEFLDNTWGLFKIIKDDSDEVFQDEFFQYWSYFEEIFASGSEQPFYNEVHCKMLSNFKSAMKVFI